MTGSPSPSSVKAIFTWSKEVKILSNEKTILGPPPDISAWSFLSSNWYFIFLGNSFFSFSQVKLFVVC